MTRLYKSRPNLSVPNQWSAEGLRRRCDGSIEIGSTVASQGAAIEASTMASSSAPPIATVGWRRTNAPKPARAGGATGRATVANAVVMSYCVAVALILDQYLIRGSSTV